MGPVGRLARSICHEYEAWPGGRGAIRRWEWRSRRVGGLGRRSGPTSDQPPSVPGGGALRPRHPGSKPGPCLMALLLFVIDTDKARPHKKQRRKKGPSSAAYSTCERIYFFFLAGAFFLAAFLAGAFFLAAFLAGAFFLAAFLAGAFFLAVANSLTSFQVFSETTSFSIITAKSKTLSASYSPKYHFSIFFLHDTRLSLVTRKLIACSGLENMRKKAGWE